MLPHTALHKPHVHFKRSWGPAIKDSAHPPSWDSIAFLRLKVQACKRVEVPGSRGHRARSLLYLRTARSFCAKS